MDDIEVTGIVLDAMPYKEKDKLIHIFTIELGLVTGILKGVSSPKAKLKFAGQPFCFGKFDLTVARDFYVVKGVDVIDCGVPVLSMHAPYEVTSKFDIYAAYKTYKAFWEE